MLKKIRKNATKRIEKTIMDAVTYITFNQTNGFKGEEIQPDYKLKKSVIEDIQFGHATLYRMGEGDKFKLHYNSNCWWEITL